MGLRFSGLQSVWGAMCEGFGLFSILHHPFSIAEADGLSPEWGVHKHALAGFAKNLDNVIHSRMQTIHFNHASLPVGELAAPGVLPAGESPGEVNWKRLMVLLSSKTPSHHPISEGINPANTFPAGRRTRQERALVLPATAF
jgi:hypothetical protein